MPKDSKFALRLFGSVRLEKNGKPLEFARRKALDLLAYLALHPSEHPRERLAALFWGDADGEAARLSLRVVVSDLRKTLGEECLIGRESLQLNPDFPLWVDAREFQRLTDSRSTPEDWLAALDVYKGEFLPRGYDDWALEWRATFERLDLETRLRLARQYRAQNQHALAADFARAALALDPARETAHQILIASLDALGDRPAALRQYDVCRQNLRDAGLEPSAETQAIHSRLQKPPVVAGAAPLGNLPRPLTSFIGREDQLNEIETLLNETRLLTLLGAGGSGKTRLAIQAADESAHNYAGGVWWVDLAPLLFGGLIPQAIAKSLGVKEQGATNLLEQIARYIGERRMLIVLDNCEHLLTACAECVEFLSLHCPALTFLATSREPLGVDGEVGWQTPTLPLPKATSVKALKHNAAARLFVERGRTANSSFQLTAQNAARVAEVCRRLDGIPLAIELAAAQVNNLTLEGILERLKQALDFSAAARHERHATLRAAIQWSYDLLNPVEQILFRRLAIFAGGWNLSAATVIAAGYADAESVLTQHAADQHLTPLPVTGETVTRQALDGLVKKALIQLRRGEFGTRYDMLDTLREFAREKLNESGEEAAAEERHARVFLGMLQNLWADAYTEREAAMLDQVEREQANLRGAWVWQSTATEWQAHQEAVSCQARFWYMRGQYAESRERFGALLAHPALQTPQPARGELLNSLGLLEWQSGNHDLAKEYFQRALADYRDLHLEKNAAMTLANCGGVHLDQDEIDAAQELLEQGITLARQSENERALAVGLNNLGLALIERGELPRARGVLAECLELRRKLGEARGMGVTLNNLGDLEAEEKNYARARQLYGESFGIRAHIGDRRGALIAALNILKLMCMDADWERAARLLGFVDGVQAQLGIQLFKQARDFQEQAATDIRAALDEKTFGREHLLGRALTLESAARWLDSL
ncbi:MAG: hypothetical protein DCC59_10675 [Chloroflexi bacterium]|nr:tetratricopeptide repeat protein [Anaerolineales bacterium]RIK52279.1 MAG: hypothetical protein DCC59_10675 [Chloroflexota bacterium]